MKEKINVSVPKVLNACYKLGCEKTSVIKKTKEGRLHINIHPLGNKTEISIHHDIYIKTSRFGHYSKSNDLASKKFISDLKKMLGVA